MVKEKKKKITQTHLCHLERAELVLLIFHYTHLNTVRKTPDSQGDLQYILWQGTALSYATGLSFPLLFFCFVRVCVLINLHAKNIRNSSAGIAVLQWIPKKLNIQALLQRLLLSCRLKTKNNIVPLRLVTHSSILPVEANI